MIKRLRQIEEKIKRLDLERKKLAKERKIIEHRIQVDSPKISIRQIRKNKWLLGSTQVGNKVYCIYLGKTMDWGDGNWKKSRKLKEYAVRIMKAKLKELEV